ncbi:MAG: 50S ribosomal protein L21 [Deltaproteobacteria bacterium RIFCSPLOWO2_12_FULL_43_16]|nr:MAG: 50S ribosomal protein L21 [Deltaproteobacteria bacterium GWA2_43_19]OGQ11893.1 MAG: 50S ribosomal protein L21 [Deltaproteobacteria bacterium RIFCSPHIGHO2_02_FULL_43_33]OGQ38160.1 MAG: 50S ribosomal protein L21 [Deltaproteobacteria bacterium RIFCSPLOWO2_01_FULL_42_9]OGQ61091.1 MAG: 50S ribosomal protein L21 [Deltaproteobacteria bacterium RIFCSPLOWO2_12_FULL_43_16]HBR18183.1 50S ribosomal protein L21 [Deltaproteobacteria bacterium]
MYAVIKTGGKQQTVSEGDVIKVEKLSGDVGSKIEFKDVLMVGTDKEVKVGQPIVAKAKVVGEILEQDKSKKVIAFKMKRRKGFHKKIGHRQSFTSIKINEIKA